MADRCSSCAGSRWHRYAANARNAGPSRHACPTLVAVGLAACLSAPLHAQSSRLGAEVALASQLVDRGLAITPATPVLQGSVSWSSPRGWSLGLASAVELRSPGRPVVVLARVSRLWAPPGDWQAQASLIYYDYRAESGWDIPDRADASLRFAYRDTLTFGLSASRVGGGQGRRVLGAADLALSWPLTRHVSLSAGAGIAEAAVASYGYDRYHYRDGRRDPVVLYGHGHLGLLWSDGPWHLQLGRNVSSLGKRRAYGAQAASSWVATLSRSF